MSGTVDLYDNAYSHCDADVYRDIRLETYGQDLGQASWATTEWRRHFGVRQPFCRFYGLSPHTFLSKGNCNPRGRPTRLRFFPASRRQGESGSALLRLRFSAF